LKSTLYLVSILLLISCNSDDFAPVTTEQSNQTPEPSKQQVYKTDGAVQCQGGGTSLAVMQQELVNGGIDVICSQKGNDNIARATVCGGAMGTINLYEINTTNVADAILLGFNPTSDITEYDNKPCDPNVTLQATNINKIYKSDGSIQPGVAIPVPQPKPAQNPTSILASNLEQSIVLENDNERSSTSVSIFAITISVDSLAVMAEELTTNSINIECMQKGSDGELYATVAGGPTDKINIYEIDSTDLIAAQALGYKLVSELVNYQDSVCPKLIIN